MKEKRTNEIDYLKYKFEYEELLTQRQKLQFKLYAVNKKLDVAFSKHRFLRYVTKDKIKPGAFYTNAKDGILVDPILLKDDTILVHYFNRSRKGDWVFYRTSYLDPHIVTMIKKYRLTDYIVLMTDKQKIVWSNNFYFH
jgi:hypothetical protein